MLRKRLKFSYYGLLGFLGFMGFRDSWYFLFFLFFLFFIAGKKGVSPVAKAQLDEFNKAREDKIKKNKDKILLLLQSKGKIKNKDVEETLSVSDATATRYLDELEKEGKVEQVNEGSAAYYIIKQS